MNAINLIVLSVKRMGVVCLLVTVVVLLSCSSAPEPQPELSKENIRQDSDRFFKKMEKEEKVQSPSSK